MRTIQSRIELLVSIAGLLLVASCTSTPSVEVESFSRGVAEAREQMALSFKAVNDISRDSMIEYAVSRPTLSESNLVVVLDPGTVRVWETALDTLQLYSQHLEVLASSTISQGF